MSVLRRRPREPSFRGGRGRNFPAWALLSQDLICLGVAAAALGAFVAGLRIGAEPVLIAPFCWWLGLSFGRLLRPFSERDPSGLPRTAQRVFTVVGWILVLSAVLTAGGSDGLWTRPPGQNQIAGSLLAFFPWWCRQARLGPTLAGRAAAAAALLATLAVWWRLPSRGALLAAGVGLATWAILIVWRRSPAAAALVPVTLSLGLSACCVLALPSRGPELGDDPVIRRFERRLLILLQRAVPEGLLLEGQLEGLRWSSLLEGRPTIWRRTAWSAIDFPAGFGVGTYTETVPRLYPLDGPGVYHAHQGWLQRRHELGSVGAAWLVLLWILAGSRLLRTALKAPQPGPAACLGGAWASAATFQVLDALPMADGSAFGAAMVLGLGLAIAPEAKPGKATVLAEALLLAAGVGGLLLLLAQTTAPRVEDEAARALLQSSSTQSAALCPSLSPPAEVGTEAGLDTGTLWLVGLCRARLLGETGTSNAAWVELLDRPVPRLLLLAHQDGVDREMAHLAVAKHGDRCEAWRLLGNRSLDDTSSAEQAWIEALRRCPDDADTWLDVARLRRADGRLGPALDAYVRACETGDPGANACLAGGELAEGLAREDVARRLYGRSRLPQARQRLEALPTPPSELKP